MVDERHRQLVEHSAEKARREGERMESKRQSSERVCQKERDRQEKAETWKHGRIEAMKERRTQHQEMENSYERAAQEQKSQRLVSDQETAPQRRSELNSFKIARCVAWWFWLGAQSNKGGRGQRNREEIVAGAASPLVRAFLRLRHSVALDKTAMLRKLNLKYIAIKNMERGTR